PRRGGDRNDPAAPEGPPPHITATGIDAAGRLGPAPGADAMKAMAIVSGWIPCTDEGGNRCVIPQGTRIKIESRADGYRVSWRDPSGRRRATRWTTEDLDLHRRRALRSYLEAV